MAITGDVLQWSGVGDVSLFPYGLKLRSGSDPDGHLDITEDDAYFHYTPACNSETGVRTWQGPAP
jgi:hypothetical protein